MQQQELAIAASALSHSSIDANNNKTTSSPVANPPNLQPVSDLSEGPTNKPLSSHNSNDHAPEPVAVTAASNPQLSLNDHSAVRQHQLTSPTATSASSTLSSPRSPWSSGGGFFSLASAALERTIGPKSNHNHTSSTSGPLPEEPTGSIRSRRSTSALSGLARLSISLDSSSFSFTSNGASSTGQASPEKRSRLQSAAPSPAPIPPFDAKRASKLPQLGDPISRPYSEADPNTPLPIRLPGAKNKMHQTSSRLLRMTDDDRPFTRDFKDLFSTLLVSLLPLSAHRVRLTRVEHTFLSEDAINNLGSLKFSQSNRMPDPKDPSRIVTTTTTTTFSMAKDMARSICQRFVDARFIQSADGKLQQVYTMKGSVWQLTPKGVCVLDRFCSRNGIQQRQIGDLVATGVSSLVILERDPQSDKIVMDRGTMEVVFRRFIGANGLNIKSSVSSADSDSLSDYKDGLTGVKIAGERKIGGKTYKDTFTGKGCSDWLIDCCTTVDRRECHEMASLFVEYDLMEVIQQDRQFMASSPSAAMFQPTKNAIYQMTARGRDVVNGAGARGRQSESEGIVTTRPGIARDSNTQRLDKILGDAALRLLFRENLRETHCEENLSFYLEVDEFVRGCRAAIRIAQKNPNATSMDGIKEIMAQAYGIYNAFLAPGSPCELNIDHQLRNNLATRMTKAVGQDVAMIDTLHEVTALFEDAQNAVFKLMASDSVPKFLRNAKYENTLKSYDFDNITGSSGGARLPERSQSRSNRK
ncbi:regulator of G-protein signaling [Apiospora marii]|uniref:regulator of G-protein signaling n=1 Tax=Apiospora marii TaxID=335849 RepID=UPI003130AB6C